MSEISLEFTDYEIDHAVYQFFVILQKLIGESASNNDVIRPYRKFPVLIHDTRSREFHKPISAYCSRGRFTGDMMPQPANVMLYPLVISEKTFSIIVRCILVDFESMVFHIIANGFAMSEPDDSWNCVHATITHGICKRFRFASSLQIKIIL